MVFFDRFENGEERWHCLGVVPGTLKVLLIVHCYPERDYPDLIRVIGLRKASAAERRDYENGEI